MKDFFKNCLEELEARTGLRQLFFLQSREDGAKQVNILLDAMVAVSQKFAYIPQEAQQKIILASMVEDQNYDSLNSRVIHRWLEANKSKWFFQNGGTLTEEQMADAAPPEVAEKYAKELLATISQVGNRVHTNGMKELRKEAGMENAISTGRPVDKVSAVIYDLRQQWISETKPDPKLAGTKEAEDSFLIWMDENVERLSNQ